MRTAPSELARRTFPIGRFVAVPLAIAAFANLLGCNNSPSTANIGLRKQVQSLTDENAHLTAQHAADQASLAAAKTGGSVELLSPARLDTLFTTTGLKIADRTGGDRSTNGLAYDDRLKIYAAPLDAYGDTIKSAGAFRVQAFDLAAANDQLIGDWSFPLSDAEKNWYGKYLMYNYVLDCPWQTPPLHGELTIKVTFIDALTQRQFEAQTVVHVTPPPSH
jgi:hypothetical protein